MTKRKTATMIEYELVPKPYPGGETYELHFISIASFAEFRQKVAREITFDRYAFDAERELWEGRMKWEMQIFGNAILNGETELR